MTNIATDETTEFRPKWDANGLMPCVAIDHETGGVLMLAYVNEDSIRKTIETGEMHYWSRSRSELWHKGATSGHTQLVKRLDIDCDQDSLIAYVEQTGAACHTGRDNCYYRTIANNIGKGPLTTSIDLKFTSDT